MTHWLVHVLISAVIHAFVYFLAWHLLSRLPIVTVVGGFVCFLLVLFGIALIRRLFWSRW